MISLEEAGEKVSDVSSLPDVAMRIIEIVNSDQSTTAELKSVVEGDPSLSARLLRTINSAAYGLSRRIETIYDAIIYLGFDQVRNLAVTASVARIFEEEQFVEGYRRQGLWTHLVCVGIAARKISLRCGLEDFEESFLAGLLHDLGIILLDQHLHTEFSHIVRSLTTERRLCDVERDILGFDHAEFGAAVAEKWRFPAGVIAAMRYHHDSTRCKCENQSIVRVVEIANFLCTQKDFASTTGSKVSTPTPSAFAALSLGREDLIVLWEDLDRELEKHEALMEI